MAENGELKNVSVLVLYDLANPTETMIDHAVWHWMPWAPTLCAGVFLILAAAYGWYRSRFDTRRSPPIETR